MKIKFAALALSAALAGAVPAQAAAIDSAYNFEATFTDGPNSKISGTVNLSFDAADSDNPITFKSFSSAALAGYTANPSPFYNFISVGNCSTDICSVASGTSQFFLNLELTPAGEIKPSSSRLIYSAQGSREIFYSKNVTVNRVVSGAVPEPSTWALMILGFGAVGYAMRRRQKAVVRFA